MFFRDWIDSPPRDMGTISAILLCYYMSVVSLGHVSSELHSILREIPQNEGDIRLQKEYSITTRNLYPKQNQMLGTNSLDKNKIANSNPGTVRECDQNTVDCLGMFYTKSFDDNKFYWIPEKIVPDFQGNVYLIPRSPEAARNPKNQGNTDKDRVERLTKAANSKEQYFSDIPTQPAVYYKDQVPEDRHTVNSGRPSQQMTHNVVTKEPSFSENHNGFIWPDFDARYASFVEGKYLPQSNKQTSALRSALDLDFVPREHLLNVNTNGVFSEYWDPSLGDKMPHHHTNHMGKSNNGIDQNHDVINKNFYNDPNLNGLEEPSQMKIDESRTRQKRYLDHIGSSLIKRGEDPHSWETGHKRYLDDIGSSLIKRTSDMRPREIQHKRYLDDIGSSLIKRKDMSTWRIIPKRYLDDIGSSIIKRSQNRNNWKVWQNRYLDDFGNSLIKQKRDTSKWVVKQQYMDTDKNLHVQRKRNLGNLRVVQKRHLDDIGSSRINRKSSLTSWKMLQKRYLDDIESSLNHLYNVFLHHLS